MLVLNPCCCNPAPLCCVLPPTAIELTSYAWSGYDRQYEDAVYSYVGRKTYLELDGTPYSYCEVPVEGQVNGLDTYRYQTAATIPEGVDPDQTNRLILVIPCADQRAYEIEGSPCIHGPALFFADGDWNPTVLVEEYFEQSVCGNMLVPVDPGIEHQYSYWQAPPNDEHMDAAWITECGVTLGSVRHFVQDCAELDPPFVAEFPIGYAPAVDAVYSILFCAGPPSATCYTIGAETQDMAMFGVDMTWDTTGCEDALCTA